MHENDLVEFLVPCVVSRDKMGCGRCLATPIWSLVSVMFTAQTSIIDRMNVRILESLSIFSSVGSAMSALDSASDLIESN